MNKQITSSQPGRVAFALLLFVATVFSSLSAQNSMGEQEPKSYSLDACIDYALKNNRNIENAQFDTYIAQKRVNELRGVGLPQVTLGGSYTQYFELPVSVIDVRQFPSAPGSDPIPDGLPDSIYFQTANFGLTQNASAEAHISQLLFDGTFFIGLKAAKEYVNLTRISELRTEEEVAVNVAKSYYNALVAEERARLLSLNLNRLDTVLSTTQALFDQGFAEKVDVDRLRIQYNNLQVEKQKVDRLVELGYDLLKFQMGMPIDEDIALSEKIEDNAEIIPLEELQLEGNFANNRVEMQLFRQQINLQELDIKRNQVGFFGSLVGFASANYSTARPRFFSLDIDPNWFRASLVGLQYNVTLFDGLQKRSRIQQNTVNIDKIRNNMYMFEQSVLLETRNASVGVVNAYADVENARRNLELAEEVARISNRKYEEGVGSNLEVIDAESTLLESQINYLAALYDYTLARVELRRVKGDFVPEINTNTENQ